MFAWFAAFNARDVEAADSPSGIRLVRCDMSSGHTGDGRGPSVLIPWKTSVAETRKAVDAESGDIEFSCMKTVNEGEEECYFRSPSTLDMKGWFADFGENENPFAFKVNMKFINDRFYSYRVDFPNIRYPAVESALRSSLGKPSESQHDPVQNKMGASFDQEILLWNRKDVKVLSVMRNWSNLQRGMMNVTYVPLEKTVPAEGAKAKAPF